MISRLKLQPSITATHRLKHQGSKISRPELQQGIIATHQLENQGQV